MVLLTARKVQWEAQEMKNSTGERKRVDITPFSLCFRLRGHIEGLGPSAKRDEDREVVHYVVLNVHN